MSTLTLYYESLLTKDKNFILDQYDLEEHEQSSSIEIYLSSLTNEVKTNFQYIKQRLNLTLKVDMNQSALDMGDGASDLNYVKIQNDGENPFYYFVMGKKWISENTIQLELEMDTLNTFMWNQDYIINEKTLVKRMHKDRFSYPVDYSISFRADAYNVDPTIVPDEFRTYKITCNGHEYIGKLTYYLKSTSYASYVFQITNEKGSASELENDLDITRSADVEDINDSSYEILIRNVRDQGMGVLQCLIRNIDLKSENISAPLYKKSETKLLEKNGTSDLHWALYYKSQGDQESDPIDCFLVPENSMQVNVQLNTGEIHANDITSGHSLIFASTYPAGKLTFEYTFDVDNAKHTYQLDNDEENNFFNLVAIANNGGTLEFYTCTMTHTEYGDYGRWLKVQSGGSVKVIGAPQYIYGYDVSSRPNATAWFSNKYYLPSFATTTLTIGATTTGVLWGKNTIDKSLSENIKIINVPYSPTSYKKYFDEYEFDTCWEFDSANGTLKLVDYSVKFNNSITTQADDIIYNLFERNYYPEYLDDTSRSIKDPKLWHSDYFRPKFVYDSFSHVFALERMDFDYYEDVYKPNFHFEQITSRNLVSKFLFKFDYTIRHPIDDYDNIVAVARNNEEVLYNSQYLNYVRTGFNYDMKAKQKQEQTAGFGLGLNIAGFLASIGIGIATENPIAIGSAVATGISLVSQIVNYAKTTAQNEDNIQRKLSEAKMQEVSVMNADDYDLLYAYSENRAKLCYYEVSDQMKDILDDLFYYGGYTINEQMIPDVTSRWWFNYVQASLVIDRNNNLTDEVEQDIKNKFDNGVTFLHYHNNTTKFDFKQDRENIEIYLIEEPD